MTSRQSETRSIKYLTNVNSTLKAIPVKQSVWTQLEKRRDRQTDRQSRRMTDRQTESERYTTLRQSETRSLKYLTNVNSSSFVTTAVTSL